MALSADPTDPRAIEREYLTSLPSPRSRATMRRCVAKLVELTGGDWATLDRWAVLRALRGLDGLATATQRLHCACLRGLLRFANADPRVLAAARAPRGQSPVAGRALDYEEQAKLVGACRSHRDRALVLALLDGGLRIAELIGADAQDFTGSVLVVRHGKGRRQRQVALTDRAVAALRAHLGGRRDGPLVATARGERLAVRGAQRVLETIGRRAGVECSPHDLRRSCVTTAVAAGAALTDVAQHVGHASVESTRRYLRADPLEQSRAVAAVLGR